MSMEAPLATGFVAWHPKKGVHRVSSHIAVSEIHYSADEALEALLGDYDMDCAYGDYQISVESPSLSATEWARSVGWQIIEVEIFRKQKDGQ